MSRVTFDTDVFSHQQLWQLGSELLKGVGVTPKDADLVSLILVETSLRGVDSHGIARLPHYLRRVEHGSINPRPQIRCEHLGPAVALLDGDDALGHVVMHHAAIEAVKMARDAGAGWVAVRNSSHCGALAHYGMQIAEEGMIGLVFTHVDSMVVPFGSLEAFCGTNPICVTAPRQPGGHDITDGPLCLDMATSRIPWNAIVNAANENTSIQEGWALDAEGNDTLDPNKVAALYPVGGYKGSGLGLVIDVLCSLLSGAPFGPDIPKMYGDLSERRQLGGLVGAIDISHFLPVESFHSRLTSMLSRWSSLPPSDPTKPVLFPGEPELLAREKRLKEGIPVGLKLLDELNFYADKLGVQRISG